MQRGGCVRKHYLDKGLIKYVGVMLKGKMEVLTDQETKDMIWHKCDTMFYIIQYNQLRGKKTMDKLRKITGIVDIFVFAATTSGSFTDI
jgi:hypothetical protein